MNGKKSILNASNRATRRYRIVGGKPVDDKVTYPWMTALCTREALSSPLDTQFCGGSLIAPNWVLTAAHCVFGNDDPMHLCVVLGLLKLDEPPKEKINVEKVIIHPKYDRGHFGF